MEQTIVLIHTVRSIVADLTRQVVERTGAKVLNLLDESLVQYKSDSVDKQKEFRVKRLCTLVTLAEEEGADLIAISCSSMTPLIKEIRKIAHVPVVSVDERAVEETLHSWNRFVLLTTAQSTADLVMKTLKAASERNNIAPEIISVVSPGMKECSYRGDMEGMEREALKLMNTIPHCEGIFLAQASTAWLKERIEKMSGVPVHTVTEYMLQDIIEKLNRNEG